MSKIIVLGLDGFSPDLVRKWSSQLPNLAKMQQDGVWGDIRCTVPPTTAQAWTSVRCGRNPGVFGYWDSTYRDDFSYSEPKQADSEAADRVDLLQKMLPKMGQRVAIINVPVSWPPKKIPAGFCITGPDTPDLESGFTYPESLAEEVKGLVGEYIIRVSEGGLICLQMEKDKLLKRVYEVDTQRLTLLKHFIREKRCDHVLAVIVGAERMAHNFYHYADETHKRHDPDPKYKNALLDYYKWIDKNVGEVRESLLSDTILIVLSAYGSQRLDGRINLNEWLIQEGYMTLLEYPNKPTPLSELKVDWPKTKAWSTGSTGSLYLNVKGREAKGVIEADDYDKLLDELAAKLKDIPDENGKKLNTQVFKRDDIQFGPWVKYGPDMFIYFDECRFATSELVGYGKGKIYSVDTPEGPDYATHSPYGYFCMAGSRIPAKGEITRISLLNIAPTVLDAIGLPIPREMERPSIMALAKEEKAAPPPPKVEDKVRSRLEALGY